MSGWDAVLVGLTLVGYALVSGRLARSPVTSAIVFTTAGLVLGSAGLGLLDLDLGSSQVRLLTELTLALVLFVDASSIDTRRLEREVSLHARLLGLGLPGTILLGTVLAVLVFPDLVVFEAMALAVLLAPTDAALGQSVVSNARLPSMVRQGLNVESGLNDGICVPLLVTALTLAQAEEGLDMGGEVVVDLVTELAIATAAGAAIAGVVALLLRWSSDRQWLEPAWAQIVPMVTAVGAYAAVDELGGSGFIGAFVAGLTYGRLLESTSGATTEFTRDLGDLLSAVTFVLFGAVLVQLDASTLSFRTLGFAVLALTVIRMVPVALSLVGSGARGPTVAFVGWFGPRGLATIVFTLTVVEESGLAGTEQIVDVATMTVLLSIFAHGLSAAVLSDRYISWFDRNRSSLTMETRDVETGLHQPAGGDDSPL
jgi:sodium/hydrogen antiporter